MISGVGGQAAQVGDGFGRAARGSAGVPDLERAERDYVAGIDILEKLVARKAIGGTDLNTLENARKEIERIRKDLSSSRFQ